MKQLKMTCWPSTDVYQRSGFSQRILFEPVPTTQHTNRTTDGLSMYADMLSCIILCDEQTI